MIADTLDELRAMLPAELTRWDPTLMPGRIKPTAAATAAVLQYGPVCR